MYVGKGAEKTQCENMEVGGYVQWERETRGVGSPKASIEHWLLSVQERCMALQDVKLSCGLMSDGFSISKQIGVKRGP